jgi:predicted O-linked N-acetylglucosamine transferase (SPINDLY family)
MLEDLINHAAGIAVRDGAAPVRAYLRAMIESGAVTGLTETQAIVLTARQVSKSHPKAALDLLEPIVSEAEPLPAALLLASFVLDKLGRRQEAHAMVKRVVTGHGALPQQVLEAANLLVRLGDQELALERGARAYQAMGQPLDYTATLLYIAQVTAAWPLVDQLTSQLRQGYADGHIERINESPRTHLLWCDDEALNLKVLDLWSRRNLPDPILPASKAQPVEGRRLRVGYLSSDFREHPTARLILGVLRHHDRSQVELFMYCSGWNDGSSLRKEVEAQFEHIHSVSSLSDEAAANLIRYHDIDVLVELNGPTRSNRMGILRYRPAPVQIDYLGWPGSVGGRVVDYIIGDDQTIPPGVEHLYPEKVIRLSVTYQANDHAAFRRAPRPSRKEVGLPEDPSLQILGMFNAINKVHQEVWDTWMAILRAAPNTLLWILDPGPVARKGIARAAQKAGVPVSRILASPKLPQAQHLARVQCCDLMLDPWPYGGHTSTADALFSGVPVLAMEGRNFASRVSPGLLRGAGLGDLVCASPEAYARRAVELLNNPDALARMRARLLQDIQTSPVFDAQVRARQLEQAYRVALERAAQGMPFQHIGFTRHASKRPSQSQASISRSVDWGCYRVAVVTPYFQVPEDKLKRCCASVASQSFTCDHILVADGEPQMLLSEMQVIHMVLPANVGNSGATPRGLGAQYAFSQGYDAVAFLDADNWYEPDHIETAVKVLEDQHLDVVYTRRNIVFEDGDILQVDDPQDVGGVHVDTNCYIFSKRAAFLMGFWALYPKEFGAGEDRYMKKIIDALGLSSKLIENKSVWYESHWAHHYRLANKAPVAPLRSPSRSLSRNWDPNLFEERTGLAAGSVIGFQPHRKK